MAKRKSSKSSDFCDLRVRVLVRRDNPRVDEALALLGKQSEGIFDVDWETAEPPEPEFFYDDDGVLRPAEWFDDQEVARDNR